jgi:hypothetical protein
MRKMRRRIAIALAFTSISLACAQSLDPAAYLETSRSSVNLPRTMAAYNAYVDRQEPYFYGIFAINATTAPGTVPTVDDATLAATMNGSFAGIDMFFYARLFKLGDYSFRAIVLGSGFGFLPDGNSTSAYESIYGYSTQEDVSWLSGYALVGLQVRKGEDRLTAGAVYRIEPDIDQGPPALFSRVLKSPGNGASTSTSSFDRFYADASWSGYRFDSLISLRTIEQVAAEKLFNLAAESLRMGPVVEYLGRQASFRPGIIAEWKPLSLLETAAILKAGIGRGKVGLGEAVISLRVPIPLIKGIRKTAKDMSLRVGLDASLIDFYGEILPGCKAEINLENYPFITWFDLIGLKYLGTLTLGLSWNHADTLSRLPFRDQPIVYLRMGGGYY